MSVRARLCRYIQFKMLLFLPIVLLPLFFLYTKTQIRKARAETKKIRAYLREADLNGGVYCSHYIDSISLPKSLCNVPSAQGEGIVLDVKTISIRNVVAPYNASIIDCDSGFLLFFRYDELYYNCDLPFKSQIGCVKLDENLNQTEEEYKTICLENEFNEDPRVFRFKNDLYLSYNSVQANRPKDGVGRIMKLARLDSETLEVKGEIELDLKEREIEKNWTPFCFTHGDEAEILFQYYPTSHKNLKLEDFSQSKLSETRYFFSKKDPNNGLRWPTIGWPAIWGELKGGTPALKVGDEYLAFFHSSFRMLSNSSWYYVMGAYTFEAKPPFRTTAISHYPILFDDIFSSPPLNTAPPTLRAVFPSGFVIKEKEGKNVIYLSIGENDSCTKVLTLDTEALLKSLKKVNF